MKAVLNVDGRKLRVCQVECDINGAVVSVHARELYGEYEIFHDGKLSHFGLGSKVENLEGMLEFPIIEESIKSKFTELIKHLEEVAANEHETLVNLAVNVMENDSFPFNESPLVEGQRQYKLMEQRVTGVIDTVEEVKAFMEGWYTNDDTPTANETEVAD